MSKRDFPVASDIVRVVVMPDGMAKLKNAVNWTLDVRLGKPNITDKNTEYMARWNRFVIQYFKNRGRPIQVEQISDYFGGIV